MKSKLLRLAIEKAIESKVEELEYTLKLGGVNKDFPEPYRIREVMQDINELVDELEKLGDTE